MLLCYDFCTFVADCEQCCDGGPATSSSSVRSTKNRLTAQTVWCAAIHDNCFRNYLLKMVNLNITNKSENKRFKHLFILQNYYNCPFELNTNFLAIDFNGYGHGVMEMSQIWKHKT